MLIYFISTSYYSINLTGERMQNCQKPDFLIEIRLLLFRISKTIN